ncbi:MAG: acyl-phosphate glycerol 3-phosphate acyltransferase [Armatimonadota bacterium]
MLGGGDHVTVWTFVLAVAAYLVGSLPFGYWVGLAMGVDVRQKGSGNIGATNVWRLLGARAGLSVLLLDVLKGYVPTFWFPMALSRLTSAVTSVDHGLLFGTCAIVGHVASAFLRLKGGKAVATSLGVMLALTPLVGAVALATFAVLFGLTRYVSLSSLIAAAVSAISVQFLSDSLAIRVTYVVVALLLFYRHRPNIGRLIRGEERRFEFSSRKAQEGGSEDALA